MIDIMFFIFVAPPTNSPQGVLFRVVQNSGGELNESSNASWSGVSENLYCDVDKANFNTFKNNPLSTGVGGLICGGGTLFGVILNILVIVGGALATITLTGGSTGIDTANVAWMGASIFFFLSLGADFIYYFNLISNIHPPLTKILAMVFLLPIGILFGLIALEWVRGKD